MIVKMKFINISGPRNDIDRVTDQYLSRYEIQLESALSELKTVENLRPFVEINPYRDVLAKAVQFVSYLPNADTVTPDSSLGLDDMFELVRNASADYEDLQQKKEKCKNKIEQLRTKQQIIAPFRPLECDLHQVLSYRFITYRFGRIAAEHYHKMQKYLMDDLGAIFVEGERDESFVYGAYFVSPGEAKKVDAVFRSLHFERIELKDEFEGTPAYAYQKLEKEIARVNVEMNDLDKEAGEMLFDRAAQLVAAKNRLEELSNNFDVRKMAARMDENQEDYYILCGWMAEDDVDRFLEEIKDDDKVFVVVEDDHDAIISKQIWECVQLEIKRRKKYLEEHGTNSYSHRPESNPFASKIICGDCNKVFARKGWRSSTGVDRKVWQCSERYKVKGVMGCANRHVEEETLIKAYLMAWNALVENREDFMGQWTEQLQSENLLEGYRAEKFIEYTDGAEPLTEMDTDFMLKTLDHIKVFEDGTLLVVFLDGTEIECKNEEE